MRGEKLEKLFKTIEESSIAIAVISSRYTESNWCLDELAKIKECVEEERMKVFPVFYKVTVDSVKDQNGNFGDYFRKTLKLSPDKKETWEKALKFVTLRLGQTVDEKSCEETVVNEIVEEVMKMLDDISTKRTEGQGRSQKKLLTENGAEERNCSDTSFLYGIETRTKQIEDKLELQSKVTRIVGVVGMPGIGKTTLARKVLENQSCNFMYTVYLDEISKKSKIRPLNRLHEDLLLELYNWKNNGKEQQRIAFSLETFKAVLRKKKIFVVLDDVSDKEQLDAILENREWLCEGSKIVIITRSESAVKGIVNDTYFVSGLSHIDALKLFNYHAFSSVEYCGDPSLRKLAGEFVDYTGGHPLAVKVLGHELHMKEKTYWESMRGMLTKGLISNTIQDGLRVTYDELSEHHKNVFLDIACFFRFGEEYHVKILLDSSSHDDIKVLADKFLINICAGRLEMNDLLYTFAMGLVSQASTENTRIRSRLFNHGDIVGVLNTNAVRAHFNIIHITLHSLPNFLYSILQEAKVRGIFFDVSKVMNTVTLDSDTFARMDDLRYLKLYNSRCPKECESECTVNFPDGVEFTLQEIRYLHWLKFPSEKFPQEFDPKNLIHLKLPYSKIEQIWDGEKDASKLKWLDLNHSRKLRTLTGLSQARNLQTLNLEGCTELTAVHREVQNMNSLVLLNLRGCTSLECLPEMNLIALKTLILSGCSSFEEFHMVGKDLKELYLDGTAIKGLPSAIGDLQSLVLLKLKDCINLSSLPSTLGNLRALEKLILSGCSRLTTLPMFQTTLKHLKTLLLDRTGICFPQQLPCGSVLLVSLDQVAENSIETYIRRKIQLMSNAVARYDEGFFLDVSIRICYPGWQLPVWFSHRMVGSVLKAELPRHWSDGGLIGIALSAVVSFANYQKSHLFIRCTCEFTANNGSCSRFSSILGGCNGHDSDEPMDIVSGHVFIGYMSLSHIKNCNGEIDYRNGCLATQASVNVEVTDGTRQVTDCEVLKCGFSLIYASTEVDHSWSPEEYPGVIAATTDVIHGDTGSNTQSEESDHQNGISSLLVAPRKDSHIREEGGSKTDHDAVLSRSNGSVWSEMGQGESSNSRVDANLKRKPVDVGDSTSEPYTGNRVNHTRYLSCLDGLFHCLRRSGAEQRP
ncbi:hypothetical protein Bca52824_030903 [Brassica carinata]|uniref:ADP-ribosyl cyclase/cyclic ADP-ribose hydrolase n=1 Tax=Brassica carinata TaxID=52824 RepID=A0A8X7V4V4_BRACI|nr:hypothetical protein Bca52824_030903 [Brassica carinata]